MAARRPAAVLSGIADKFKSASGHPGWIQDSAANYDFGRFGTALEAAQTALACASAAGKPLCVLDAGCGSGGQLIKILELASERGVPVFLRGLTAEINSVPPALEGCVKVLERGCDKVSGDPFPEVLVYHSVPLEDIATTGADFILAGHLFDLILCSWTLFHLCDPLGTLLQLRALLHPDGILLANGIWFHVMPPACGDAIDFEAGSVRAMEQLLAGLPSTLQHHIQGEDVRWIPADPDDEQSDGEFQGGFSVSICWTGGGSDPKDVVAKAANVADYLENSEAVLGKVWHLHSGPQYDIAAYKLL